MRAAAQPLLSRFMPAAAGMKRSEIEMARVFVFTHVFGPVIAQPMVLYLLAVSPRVEAPLVLLCTAVCAFWTLPFLLRATGSMAFASFASFQLLTATALFGTFFYGGFSSPFLPWLIVALLLGLFYHGHRPRLILGVFAADIAVFLAAAALFGLAPVVPVENLRILGWLSVAAATIYMGWMAVYYATVMALRDEMEAEAERYRLATVDLSKAREAAERSGRARARFFSKMSHELRTPLNAIIGFSEILQEECEADGGAGGQRAADLGRINTAGRHLLSLVADVLSADADPAGPRVQLTEFALRDVLGEVVANVEPLVAGNGNRLVVACPDGDTRIVCDRTMLRQMLINLLSNAAKFTSGGTIRLEAVPGTDDGETVSFAVADTGIGIRPEAQARLFADYEQADASTSARFGGTGLGLSLTRRQAILLGGDISLWSRPGEGSRFTLSLPARAGRPGPAAADEPPDRPALLQGLAA